MRLSYLLFLLLEQFLALGKDKCGACESLNDVYAYATNSDAVLTSQGEVLSSPNKSVGQWLVISEPPSGNSTFTIPTVQNAFFFSCPRPNNSKVIFFYYVC